MSLPHDASVLVTGASRGLGRALALALAKAGHSVIGVARTNASLAALADAQRSIVTYGVDITEVDQVDRLRKALDAEGIVITGLVNAAGRFGPLDSLWESEPTAWIGTIEANLVGPYLMARAFLPSMVERGFGRIINLSSAASLAPPVPFNSAYVASKAALNTMTRVLATELQGTGVTANVIHPGELKTEMWESLRAQVESGAGESLRPWVELVERTGGDPPELASRLVQTLLSPSCEETGLFHWIDGGLTSRFPTW